MKSLFVIYHYTLETMKLRAGYIFDDQEFPVELPLEQNVFESKSEFKDFVLRAALSQGYKKVRILSSETMNAMLLDEDFKTLALTIFDEHGEVVEPSEDQERGILSKIFRREP